MKSVSIITVVKNSEATIRKTILSAIVQRNLTQQCEYILIDGDSTDGTESIIAEYRHQIDVVVQEIDGGIYCAMNKGLELSSKRYVYFLNAGDVFMEDFNFASVPDDVDIVLSPIMLHNNNSFAFCPVVFNTKSSFERRLAFGDTCSHQGFLCKRTLHPYFDTRYSLDADRLMICMALHSAASVLVLYDPIAIIAYPGASSAYLTMIKDKLRHLRSNDISPGLYFVYVSWVILKKIIWLLRRAFVLDFAAWR